MWEIPKHPRYVSEVLNVLCEAILDHKRFSKELVFNGVRIAILGSMRVSLLHKRVSDPQQVGSQFARIFLRRSILQMKPGVKLAQTCMLVVRHTFKLKSCSD